MIIIRFLLILCFWGISWIAIAWQAGDVPSLVSIFYRFAFAGAIFMAALLVRRRLQPSSLTDHAFFMLQGLFIVLSEFYRILFCDHLYCQRAGGTCNVQCHCTERDKQPLLLR